jgi:hypothetical protein
MATKQRSQAPAPLARSQLTGLTSEPGGMLLHGRVESQEHAEIALKTRTDLLRMRAYGAKQQTGLAVMKQAASAVEQTFVAYAAAEQALLSQVTPEAKSQAEQFFTDVRTLFANGMLDLQHIANEKVKEVAVDAVEPPPGGETVIEEQLPFAGGLFGGTKVTRVRR